MRESSTFCAHKNTLDIETFPRSFKIVEQFSHSEEEKEEESEDDFGLSLF